MEEIISRLVEARHKAKLTLEDIQQRTKIPLRQLEYLESYQFDKIGPSVYVKGFIRRYAQEVGIVEYSLMHEEGKVPVTATRIKSRRSPAHFSLAPILRVIAILSLLVIAGFFIRTGLKSFLQSQPPAPPDPPLVQDPGPNDQDPIGEPEPEPQVTLEELRADASEAVYVVHNAQFLEVVVTFSGDCWTRITADGERISSETFRNGHIEEVRDFTLLRIRFGAPKFATVTANGIEIDTPDVKKAFNLEIRLADQTE